MARAPGTLPIGGETATPTRRTRLDARIVLTEGMKDSLGTSPVKSTRSGLAAKHGITIVNTPGTVDAGYRGEIRVILLNTDRSEPYTIAAGDRIAQLVVLPVTRARFVPVERLPGSHRGDAGFGSTGYATQGVSS